MRRIRIALWGLLLGLTGLWLLADTLWPQPFGYFPFRGVFVQYSGVIAMGSMAACMLLALRPVWLESALGGLDKMYRLHKWLGIAALVSSVLHWWWAKGTKWMVGWGWLERPARGAGAGAGQQADGLAAWLGTQRGLAETLGEWAFYAALILMVLALVKRFPYRLFIQTHKILAITYLVLAWHTLVLTKFAYWTQPVGWVMAVLVVGGVVAAVLVLLGRVGAGRKTGGVIGSMRYFPGLQVLATTVHLEPGWPGHQAGQFAFVHVVGSPERPHPYTMASSWDPQKRDILFVTKALGDHTSTLHEVLKPDLPVVVEGPYGRFTFNQGRGRQIWIGGGIGITPFLARMQQMQQEPGVHHEAVDLFYTTAQEDADVLQLLNDQAAAAGVRLQVLVDRRDGYLTGERLRQQVPDWQTASVWFCGPTPFAEALRQDLMAHGLTADQFHQELFAMR